MHNLPDPFAVVERSTGPQSTAYRLELGHIGAAAVAQPDEHAEALKAERKRVVRHFQHYTAEERAAHAASRRLGHRQKQATGQHFYTHPDVPGIAFDTRPQAAQRGLLARTGGVR